jgi:hypothetical protein
MKRLFIVFGFLIAVFVFIPQGFAEVHSQKDGLFWLDVPQGWEWQEGSDQVVIKKINDRESIIIKFYLYVKTVVAEDTETMLQGARNTVIQEMASQGGKSVMKINRHIAGVPAWHLGFLVPSAEGLLQTTCIVFFNKDYFFNISCDSDREYKRLKMEAIIDTFSFQAPKKPEPLVAPEIKQEERALENATMVPSEEAQEVTQEASASP